MFRLRHRLKQGRDLRLRWVCDIIAGPPRHNNRGDGTALPRNGQRELGSFREETAAP